MTIGNKADMSTTAKIGKGNSLSSTGTQKSGSDYKDPNIYYQVSTNKEASMTATLTSGEKDIVVYLGYTGTVDTNTSTLFSSCIKLKIDGVEKTISNNKTLFTAGFGTTQQNYRTAYMFNILGCYDLSAGQHTVTITVTSGTFNIGTICVFDHVVPNA